MIKSA
jgi:predicted nucleic acid-binding protein